MWRQLILPRLQLFAGTFFRGFRNCASIDEVLITVYYGNEYGQGAKDMTHNNYIYQEDFAQQYG